MLSAQTAISTTRRGMTVGAAVRGLMWVLVLGAAIAGPFYRPQVDVLVVLIFLAGLWTLLVVRSFRAARLTADFPQLVASGQFDQAESQIESTLRAFSLFRPAKLLALHQLAVLRHAQERYADAAAIARELLRQRLGRLSGLSTSTFLILAQSSLELNDLASAGQALARLGGRRLAIGESLNLLALQLDYQSRIGAWPAMMSDWMPKVQLAEVMPAAPAAVSQALLALAANKIGRDDAAKWLGDRASLLADVQELVKQRPVLAALWPAVSVAAVSVAGSTATNEQK